MFVGEQTYDLVRQFLSYLHIYFEPNPRLYVLGAQTCENYRFFPVKTKGFRDTFC